jgi:diaminohydroxyphosphoribosylaminopyrimidine deaminase / 5-amino-6-(5-phosphoribosylamino)uracil reductase
MFDDAHYMRLALALAERGRGTTSPNPLVGAVVVDAEGVVVGRGAHRIAGGPHAEIVALEDAGDRARGATLYCTLEPCCHTGRTGPCAPRVVSAGVHRAVVAAGDPNPLVSGRGLAHFREHGIGVTTGLMAAEAERQNRAFMTRIRRGRPFVTLKAALSLDGRIAAAPGVRTALTGEAANRLIHRERAEVDAIAVGSSTVLADDPRLTARAVYRARPLVRAIFDRRLRTPVSAAVFSTLAHGPVIMISAADSRERAPAAVRALEDAGARVELVSGEPWLRSALESLAGSGVSSLVVEGGAALHHAFWAADLVDRVELYVAAVTLGSAGLDWLSEPVVASGRLSQVETRFVGADVRIEGYVHRVD